MSSPNCIPLRSAVMFVKWLYICSVKLSCQYTCFYTRNELIFATFQREVRVARCSRKRRNFLQVREFWPFELWQQILSGQLNFLIVLGPKMYSLILPGTHSHQALLKCFVTNVPIISCIIIYINCWYQVWLLHGADWQCGQISAHHVFILPYKNSLIKMSKE